MSSKSNNQGRAYEFAFVRALEEIIGSIRPVKIIDNSSLRVSRDAFDNLEISERETYLVSARAGVEKILDLEPLISEGDDKVSIEIQQDKKGEEGDVRDIIIYRDHIKWEIGLSVKHNHFAVKHSRLSSNIDFGEKWYNIPCSDEYFESVNPIFERLRIEKTRGAKWNSMTDKVGSVYVPILEAFQKEIRNQYENNPELPTKLVEYLLGKFDFYKTISIDSEKMTKIQSYNLRGTLNRNGAIVKRQIEVPVVKLPTRIIALEFKPGSNTTLELYMNEGWQFSFRIHNASTIVEPSLKFDIQIVGMPTTIMTIDSSWI